MFRFTSGKFHAAAAVGGVPAQAAEGREQGGGGGGREGRRQGGEGGGEGVMACRLSRHSSWEYQVDKLFSI